MILIWYLTVYFSIPNTENIRMNVLPIYIDEIHGYYLQQIGLSVYGEQSTWVIGISMGPV